MDAKTLYDSRKLTLIFWSMVLIHIITWAIVPVFIRHAVSNDIIEAITWGNQFEWGYDKNPWMPALLAHLGVVIGGESAIGIYFIQQLFLLTALWSIWRLTALLSNNEAYALIASMMLEGCVCYTLNVQLYNDNYILLGLWPLSALWFYKILTTNQLRYWLLLSATLGLATMGKYDTVILVALYGLYVLLNKNYWHFLRSIKPWTALLFYFLILFPNLLWLYHHQFISIHYAFIERADFEHQTWSQHFLHNLGFIGKTLLNFLPAFLLMLTAFPIQSIFHSRLLKADTKTYPLYFPFLISFAPILFLLFIALLMGLNLANEWGMVLMGYWGTFLLLMYRPSLTKASLTRFIIIIYLILIAWPTGYLLVSLKMDTGNYPGPELASIVTNQWRDKFHTPLCYVAGSRYVAGYVGFYSKDHPKVFMEYNSELSPWINLKDFRCKGAVFIQDSGHTVMQENMKGTKFSSNIVNGFPNLIILSPETLGWYRNHKHRHALSLLIGFLPPSSNCAKQ